MRCSVIAGGIGDWEKAPEDRNNFCKESRQVEGSQDFLDQLPERADKIKEKIGKKLSNKNRKSMKEARK